MLCHFLVDAGMVVGLVTDSFTFGHVAVAPVTEVCLFTGTDIDVAASSLRCATEVQSLQFWAAHRIIKLKTNYFLIKTISESMKDYMSSIYNMFNICAACKNARLLHEQGKRTQATV